MLNVFICIDCIPYIFGLEILNLQSQMGFKLSFALLPIKKKKKKPLNLIGLLG